MNEAKQEPVAWSWVDLQNHADEIVRGKSLWKRFIDGTPLSNDIACWMADFALEHSHPAPVNAQEVRLWDSQWVNVVNHDNAYRDWSKEDAINHAVKMTEKLIAENVNGNKLPPAPVNQQLLEALRLMVENFCWGDMNDGEHSAITKARAAIAAAEGKV